MINQNEKNLLLLISRALFETNIKLPSEIDWEKLYNEAQNQTVLPLIYYNLSEEEKSQIPKALALKWESTALRYIAKGMKVVYEQQTVLKLLDKNNIKCAILKGSSTAINYPIPNLRVMGDIDILVCPQEQNRVVGILQQNGYSQVLDEEHHCHLTVFKNGIAVEVHKEPNGLFVNEDSNIKEKLDDFFLDTLEKLKDENGTPILDDKRQSLVLIIHKLEHFLSGGLGLRQVCDWAVFVAKILNKELWDELEPILRDFGLFVFTNAITKVCIDYLGLPKEGVPFEPICDLELSKKVIEHIMNCGNFGIKDRAYGERFFVDPHSKNRILSFFKVMISACKMHWPICDKYKILMPIAPFVVYARYLKQRINGERVKFETLRLYKNSGSKQQLYKELKPFIVDESSNKDGE